MDTRVDRNTMSEEHDADETSRINRRNFVKALSTTGVLGISGVGSARALPEDEAEIKREVTEITGSAHQKYVSKALSDSEVKLMTKDFEQDGWRSDGPDATVIRVDGADEDSDLDFSRYHIVSVPFRVSTTSRSDIKSVQVFWTDKSLEEVGFTTPVVFELKGDPEVRSGSVTRNGKDNPSVVTEYTVENGKIAEDRSVVESNWAAPETEDVTIQGCYCHTTVVKCESLSIWCYISLAITYAGTYWTCAACGLGAWLACGKCAAVVIGSGASTIGCIANADCWEERVCVSWEKARANPCAICDEVHHPNC